MNRITRYVRWQDGDMWLGYIEEFPDYWTQGTSLSDLEEHLRDLYGDLRSGEIPGVHRSHESFLAQRTAPFLHKLEIE